MRAMFNCAGADGHVLPMVTLARAVEAAGHDVVFVTDDRGCRLLEARGLRAIPLDESAVETTKAETVETIQGLQGLERLRFTVNSFLAAARLHARRILDVADDERPTVLVRESTSWGAWIAGEVLDIPVAMFDFTPPPTGFFADALGDLFNDLRTQFGLASDPSLDSLDQWLTILGAPPGWYPPECFRPTTHLLQPPRDPASDAALPDWFDTLPERPTIYVTLGTVFAEASGVLRMLIEAVENVDANIVMTVGRAVDPTSLGPVPPHVHVERYIPQALVLGRCDAVVAHGGYGSLMGALRHGLPMVSIPLAAADNHINAARVARLGAGIVVADEGRSATTIRSAIDALLGDTSYRDTAQRISAEMAALPDFETAVGLIEQVVDTGQPVLATMPP